jgi:hypothetical protein
MPKEHSPAHGEHEARSSQDAALAHLLDLIARLLARRRLRVQDKEVKSKRKGKNRNDKTR